MKRPYTDFAFGVRKQATLPEGAIVAGIAGTAPAVVLEVDGCVAVTLPGPPRELQELWAAVLETEPLRRLRRRGTSRANGARSGSTESASRPSRRRSPQRAAKGRGSR